MSGLILPNDQSAMSLLYKTEYTLRVVVPLVIIFNCLPYDWMVKDE
jgi:hypothetical protein